MKHKRTELCKFTETVILNVLQRDRGCLFCRIGYHLESALPGDLSVFDIMHVINKSQGGLGVEKNGVQGCRYHHHLLDNGNKGLREVMLELMEEHLRSLYPGWTKESVTYNKYKDLVVYRKRGSHESKR
jgi:hypothetical protein